MEYKGLSDDEVKESLGKYGRNLLTPPKRRNTFLLYLDCFKDPIIRVLLVAALISSIISIYNGEFSETLGIIFAIFLSTGIGFWFEFDANRKFDLLNKMDDEELYRVMRNGEVRSVRKEDIVVGDIVILESGNEVPADGDLIESNRLTVNESCMTGELSVHKHHLKEFADNEATYPSWRVLRGTTILEGNCLMRVDKVGDRTEFGRIAVQATEIVREKTPLAEQLEKLAKFVGSVALVVSVLAFLSFTYFEWQSGSFDDGLLSIRALQSLLEAFMISVAVLVVAIPEGLPMSITLSLALSMRKMLKTNNLVRKMHACETIGAATVICTDKTGTLTRNVMHVEEFYNLDGNEEMEDIVYCNMAVNSTANLYKDEVSGNSMPLGNPTEGALLLWLQEKGKSYHELRGKYSILLQLPFSTEYKFMATLVDYSGRKVLLVKGAPEILMARSVNLDKEEKNRLESRLEEYQDRAMRTLAFAFRYVDKETIEKDLMGYADGLTFLSVAAIADPLREEVPSAIKECRNAGIEIKIVTGDTAGTAKEIAFQCGIIKDKSEVEIMTGTEFAALSDEAALEEVRKLNILCRARPSDKQRLVGLLKKNGEVVAVTGDGTNDAPALNKADVGLSMGSGTSVAKETSDITLLDDSFASIISAVLWGRSLYRNIQRFILFQLTINITAMLIVVAGPLIGIGMPLTVTQILWVNLIIDTFASMSLSSLPPDMDVMDEKPRNKKAFIIVPKMGWAIVSYSALFSLVLLGAIFYLTHKDGLITPHELCVFFTFFVFLQFWNLFNAKAFFTKKSAFSNLGNCEGFLLALLLISVGQFLMVEYGGEVFRTEHLSAVTWIKIIFLSSIPLLAGEIFRSIKRYFFKHHGKITD